MEDKTKSTLAHIASITTAIAGIVTALITRSAADSKGEKVYDVLKDRVVAQGEHIKMLEESNRELRALILQPAWKEFHAPIAGVPFVEVPISLERDGDGVPDEVAPKPAAEASPPPPPPPPKEDSEPRSFQSELQKSPWEGMPSYQDL